MDPTLKDGIHPTGGPGGTGLRRSRRMGGPLSGWSSNNNTSYRRLLAHAHSFVPHETLFLLAEKCGPVKSGLGVPLPRAGLDLDGRAGLDHLGGACPQPESHRHVTVRLGRADDPIWRRGNGINPNQLKRVGEPRKNLAGFLSALFLLAIGFERTGRRLLAQNQHLVIDVFNE